MHSAKAKICKYCGEIIENPTHWKQKYHHDPMNGNTESCTELANKERIRIAVRRYRKKLINNGLTTKGKKRKLNVCQICGRIHNGTNGIRCSSCSDIIVYEQALARRRDAELILWKRRVKRRDNNLCQKCGTNKDLQVHHIKNYAQYPEMRYKINNGIVLCKSCHISLDGFHSKYGRKNNNLKQLDKFLDKNIVCEECGENLKESFHGNTKYCKECRIDLRREQTRIAMQDYRHRWPWSNRNFKGSRNAHLGESALPNFDKEFKKVHREKVRLCGND